MTQTLQKLGPFLIWLKWAALAALTVTFVMGPFVSSQITDKGEGGAIMWAVGWVVITIFVRAMQKLDDKLG